MPELSDHVGNFTQEDVKAEEKRFGTHERLMRCLPCRPRATWSVWQRDVSEVNVRTHSDSAGDWHDRSSVGGRMLMIGEPDQIVVARPNWSRREQGNV